MNSKQDNFFESLAYDSYKYASARTARIYCLGFLKLFLRQLKYNRKITVPKFGTFTLETKKERIMKVGDPKNGGVKYICVEPRNYITFTPSAFLDRTINENNFKILLNSNKPKTIKDKKEKRKKNNPTQLESIAEIFNSSLDKLDKKQENGE